MLDTFDKKVAGHMAHDYDILPSEYDKRMVVKKGSHWFQSSAMYYKRNFLYQGYDELRRALARLAIRLKYGETLKWGGMEYSFYGIHGYSFFSAKQILRKCKDFQPDVISIHWVSKFITPQVIRDLHLLTGAHIILSFVDQQHLAGGCHYHCDCQAYLSTCENCPALKTDRQLAHDQMMERIQCLRDIPITLVGSALDMEEAKRSPAYQHADIIEITSHPRVSPVSRLASREQFGLKNDEFVVLLGAVNLSDTRKGVPYALDAIHLFAKDRKDITLLLLGDSQTNIGEMPNVRVVRPGFLNTEDMVRAFCASDVFISPSIADSGPFMVNYSVALGIPVVSFDIGIAHTLIRHGETGYLADYKSAESICEGLHFVYRLTPEQRQQVSHQLIATMDSYKEKGYWFQEFLWRWKQGKIQTGKKEKAFLQ